jgi:hypothetical protein
MTKLVINTNSMSVQAADEWILPGRCGVDALVDAAEAICDQWPQAVVEDTGAHEFAHSVDALVPTEESELCVYRDLNAARRWQHGEQSAEMHNSMIQISLTKNGVRLIADNWRDPETKELATHISRSASLSWTPT